MWKQLALVATLLAQRALAIQGVHLVNCGFGESGNRVSSEIHYYADDANAQPGRGYTYRYNIGHIQHWEGVGFVEGDFNNNGGHWRVALAADAQSRPLYTAVGDGFRVLSTSTEHYKCYLDNKHQSYRNVGEGGIVFSCDSIYYCLRN